MYRNNQSRRARNGSDKGKLKRVPIIPNYFRALIFPLFFNQHFTDSSDTRRFALSTELPGKKEERREIQTRPRENCFLSPRRRRKKLSGTQS